MIHPLTSSLLQTHLSADSIVMKPHAGVDVPVGLTGVQKVPRELLPEIHIGAAAAPLPGVLRSRQVGGEVLHHTVHHTLPPVDGLQLKAVQLDAKGLLVAAALLVTAACLQLAHRAGVGHRVHHACSCDGVCEGTLSKTCEDERGGRVSYVIILYNTGKRKPVLLVLYSLHALTFQVTSEDY